MPTQVITLIVVGAIMFLVIGGLAFLSHYYTLDGIKSKTVGDGQHGTARWATKQEIRQTYAHVPFEPELWRKGEHLPEKQGLVLGCEGPKDHVTALVDTDDIHAMVTAASGAGKTAFFLYPNIEYALASGMSFLCTDTKGDLFRNYAGIAKDCYGYQIAVLDLRTPCVYAGLRTWMRMRTGPMIWRNPTSSACPSPTIPICGKWCRLIDLPPAAVTAGAISAAGWAHFSVSYPVRPTVSRKCRRTRN